MPDYRPQGRPEKPDFGKEGPDINLLNLIIACGSLLMLGLMLHFSLGGLLGGFQKRPASWVQQNDRLSASIQSSQVPPPPRLRADPDRLLAEIKAEQYGLLRSYGYLDPRHSIVHIPIERAKALLLERGIPAATGPVPSPRPGPQTAPGGQVNVR